MVIIESYGFLVIIIGIRRWDHPITDTDQATAVVAVVVILPQTSHQVISEVEVIQVIVIPTIGGRTRITDEIMIEDHRHQTPTPSGSFFLGCDTITRIDNRRNILYIVFIASESVCDSASCASLR